jgi:hypothetical protein
MTRTRNRTLVPALAAIALALAVSFPLRAALACGGYRLTDEQLVQRIAYRHMTALEANDTKSLESMWSDVDVKLVAAWTNDTADELEWKISSTKVVDGAIAVITMEVEDTPYARPYGERLTLVKRSGSWQLVSRTAIDRKAMTAARD